MAINRKTGGKPSRAVGGGGPIAPQVGMQAPGSVVKRAKVPGGQGKKGKPNKGATSATFKSQGRSMQTNIGNRRAGTVRTGVMRQFLGGKQS